MKIVIQSHNVAMKIPIRHRTIYSSLNYFFLLQHHISNKSHNTAIGSYFAIYAIIYIILL